MNQTNTNGCGAGVLFFIISVIFSFREYGHATELSLSILQCCCGGSYQGLVKLPSSQNR